MWLSYVPLSVTHSTKVLYRILLSVAVVCLVVALASDVGAYPLAPSSTPSFPEVALEPYVDGLRQPVGVVNAGDARLFVLEQAGTIRVVGADGRLVTTPFLDISDRVKTTNWEQGLLGLAFHPSYPDNGYFYVNYTTGAGDTRVSRFQVRATDSNVADPSSETPILTIPQPEDDHNAGDLQFGPDGYLYVAVGDGGSTKSFGTAQDPTNLLGAILRIDVDTGQPYSIPPDNPFMETSAARDEIWAMGLRNPWRFSIDRNTGDFYIGDVGAYSFEELNVWRAGSTTGVNYGWPCYEGKMAFFTQYCDADTPVVFPISSYANDERGCAIVAGRVYYGDRMPTLNGHHVFTDFCQGTIWSLTADASGAWQRTMLARPGMSISSIGEGIDGELYVAGYATGTIYVLRAKR